MPNTESPTMNRTFDMRPLLAMILTFAAAGPAAAQYYPNPYNPYATNPYPNGYPPPPPAKVPWYDRLLH